MTENNKKKKVDTTLMVEAINQDDPQSYLRDKGVTKTKRNKMRKALSPEDRKKYREKWKKLQAETSFLQREKRRELRIKNRPARTK